MEEPHNHDDNNDDVAIAVVAGGAHVAAAAAAGGVAAVIDHANAAADAVADVSNNEAVGVAEVEAAGNGDFDDDAAATDDDTDNDNVDEEEEEDTNDDDDDDDDEEEEEEATNDDDDNSDANNNEVDEEDQLAIQKLLSVLQQRDDFPVRQRNKIIELAHQFVNNLGADIIDMVTDQRTVANGYAGLDSNRDTPKEVETALRHYPETLSERGGYYDRFPIQCITIIDDRVNRKWIYNPMAVSFVVLFAKLAIELNLFADEERGGLLATSRGDEGDNTLRRFIGSSHKFCDKDYHQRVDTEFLAVLVQLQRSDLFKKEDIEQYELVHELCKQGGYFAEKRFHFLTNWDPLSLLRLGDQGELPLHYSFATRTIQQFQVMLDCYFQYFTKEQVICCLFQNDNHGHAPFKRACKALHKHKTDTLVHNVIEQSLGTARRSSPNTTPSASSLNIGIVLMMATHNDNISLDGWYYFIRRQPDTMLSMLHTRRRHCCNDTASVILSSSSSTSSNNNTGTNCGTTNGTSIDRTNTNNNTDNDDDTTLYNNNNNNNVIVRRRTTRKRKQRS